MKIATCCFSHWSPQSGIAPKIVLILDILRHVESCNAFLRYYSH